MNRDLRRPIQNARLLALGLRAACATLLAALALAAVGLSAALPARAADPFLRRTATVDVVERVGPSVVNILAEDAVRQESPFRFSRPNSDTESGEFFGAFYDPRARVGKTLGSGVIFDREGHVLTNAHVIEGVRGIRVALSDGRVFAADVVGADESNDLAVLRIQMEPRETLPFTRPGESQDLMVGEPVIAIGNPFGFSNTVTTGVISAVDRTLNKGSGLPLHGLLQTDASINPGNSGGPLLNAEGRLIGINSAIWGGAQGIGFAIPIDTARRIINELLLYDEVRPVWLGLEFQRIDPALQQILDLPNGARGVLVQRVQPGSPAAEAGLERGDIIVGVDGRRVASAAALNEGFNRLTDGQSIDFELFREGEILEAKAVAAEMPIAVVSRIAHSRLGLELEHTEREQAYAIRSVREGSGAEALGIRAGDFLLQLNGEVLRDYESLRRGIAKVRGKTRALVLVQRGPGRYHLTIPLQ
ncbi:MAG: trypsin-like peptidase domain-containing protein [bacterium]|nr:trypsin-like peptidase domain-containing protein [bacterium]